MSKYVNPFTDFGFKKIFGEEASKPILLDFLNSLLPETTNIKDLTFKNNEQLGDLQDSRKVIFDLYCENDKGEKFIVELQKARQNFFKERTIYYSTFPIREQVEKNELKFNLKAVYCIGILDFAFRDYGDNEDKNLVVHEIKLKNQKGSVFYDKLTYIYLEMPNFKKGENELGTRLEKWLYFIKNLNNLDHIPAIFSNEVVFSKAFEKAEISALSNVEYNNYINSMKGYSDLKAVIETAVEEAVTIALTKAEAEKQLAIEATEKKARLNMAKELKKNGVDIHLIQSITGLNLDELDLL